MSGPDGAGSPGRHGRTWIIAAAALLVLVTSPFALLALLFWAADGSWEFSGRGFRHWLFIEGSTVGRLGIQAAGSAPVRYAVRLGEGTDPGATIAVYDSPALPGAVVAAYAERCRALGIAIRKRTVAADAAEATLVCEADPAAAWADDVWVIATRAAGAPATEVRLTVGPGLTGIYSF